MKITKSQLKRIIKEELQAVLKEASEPRFLTRMAKEMPVRSLAKTIGGDPDTDEDDAAELRDIANKLEGSDHWNTPEGMRELSSYTCPQLEEVMRQGEEGRHNLTDETLAHMNSLMRKKGCQPPTGAGGSDWYNR